MAVQWRVRGDLATATATTLALVKKLVSVLETTENVSQHDISLQILKVQTYHTPGQREASKCPVKAIFHT